MTIYQKQNSCLRKTNKLYNDDNWKPNMLLVMPDDLYFHRSGASKLQYLCANFAGDKFVLKCPFTPIKVTNYWFCQPKITTYLTYLCSCIRRSDPFLHCNRNITTEHGQYYGCWCPFLALSCHFHWYCILNWPYIVSHEEIFQVLEPSQCCEIWNQC